MNVSKLKRKLKELEKYDFTFEPTRKNAELFVDRFLESAVSGQEGHNRTFAAACALVRNYPSSVAWDGLTYFNATKCSPSWTDEELRHKFDGAARKEGYKYSTKSKSKSPIKPITTAVVSEFVTAIATPPPLPNATITHLSTCFTDDEFVNIAYTNKDKKPVNGGLNCTVEEWKYLLTQDNSIYSHFKANDSGEANGCYICINPLINETERNKNSVSAYRHLLVEFDKGTKEEQYATIVASQLPCSVVIDSGGKSIHAWVKVDASDKEQFAERQEMVYSLFPNLDKQNSDPCRYSRLAGQKRGDKTQELLATNIGLGSFTEWEEYHRLTTLRSQFPAIKPITEFTRPLEDDPSELIKGRYLSKGGGMLFIGGAGLGKSVMQTQLCINWAMGKSALGMTPTRPIKSLIIQAEDDDGDVGEMKDSIFTGMGIQKGSVEENTLRKNVSMVSLNSVSGESFIRALELYVHDFKPDIVWINPVLSYLGADANSQQDVSAFLRNGINPILTKYGCACIIIHHSAKPLKDSSSNTWSNSNYAYYGLGSVEWANWARAVMVLLEVDGQTSTFVLRGSKRGKRLKWVDQVNQTQKTCDKFIRHSTDNNCLQWVECVPHEINVAIQNKNSGKQSANKQKADENYTRILEAVPTAPLTISRRQLEVATGLTLPTIRKYMVDMIERGEIVETENVNGRRVLSRPSNEIPTQDQF